MTPRIKEDKWEWFKEHYEEFGYVNKGRKYYKTYRNIMALHITKRKIDFWPLTHLTNFENWIDEAVLDLMILDLIEWEK